MTWTKKRRRGIKSAPHQNRKKIRTKKLRKLWNTRRSFANRKRHKTHDVEYDADESDFEEENDSSNSHDVEMQTRFANEIESNIEMNEIEC